MVSINQISNPADEYEAIEEYVRFCEGNKYKVENNCTYYKRPFQYLWEPILHVCIVSEWK